MGHQERIITKAEFKTIFFRHALPNSGWTQAYWDQFFENEQDGKYSLVESSDPAANRMFIRSEGHKHCIYFLTEDSEESFFGVPEKE